MNSMEIICIGNELLIGKILNTNENWLAKRSTSSAFNVTRITTVGDEVDQIKTAIREALKRKPKLIVTTGGLGPTHDDKTLQGAAEALEKPLIVDERALEMVKEKYREYSKIRGVEKIELTPARIKMATIPEGCEPLPNPVGTAPGVLWTQKDSSLILLPGVPSEMKAIFEESIIPLMRRESREAKYYEGSLFLEGLMESSLAPIIDQIMNENPYVYIKSHPKGEEKIPHIEIHLSTTAMDSETAQKRIEKVMKQFHELIPEYIK